MVRSAESNLNRNDLMLSIARWFLPGFMALVKNCMRARKQLRKEAFGTDARGKPFVKELIDDEVFIDHLFSPSTVEKNM